MGRLRNPQHELVAQALADGKSRTEAMLAAGYTWHRGNQNPLAQLPEVIARVEELRKYSDQIVDLRKVDRASLLIELARIACADLPLRAAIAAEGPKTLAPDQPVLLVDVRLDGVLAKHIEMRLLDDRGALTALLRYDNAPDRSAPSDFNRRARVDHAAIEPVLRALLAN
jgi:hypothetical protein